MSKEHVSAALKEQSGESPERDPHEHHFHDHFHSLRHKAHRLTHLIHPSGKHYHIVFRPQEVEPKRHELAQNEKAKNDFDVLVYGTPEHLSTIRDIQDHHLSRRHTLRQKNTKLFEEFDELHDTLDHLSNEISQLTDHAVALDASFNKYGYHAHIRTKEDIEAPTPDSTTDSDRTLTRSGSSAEERHADRSIEPIRFWRKPTIRQYFHKGLLWRSARSGEVGTFELFTDLIYVGVIDYVGEAAVTNASGATFLHFVVLFSLAYKIWSDLTVTINWFEVEDCFGRFFVLFILCCLYGFNSNIEYFFDGTFTAGIAFYLTQRLFLVCGYLFTSYLIPMIRGSMVCHASVAFVAAVLFIAAIHIEYPYSLIPLFFAIFVDFFGGVVVVYLTRSIKDKNGNSAWKSKIASSFEFIPAINIEHRVERTSAFTTLVFGYSILKSLYQSRAHVGVNAYLGKGILAVVQAFTIMWIYFDIDSWAVHVHAIRRHWASSSIWIVAHAPLSGAFILASSTLGELVLAHDCLNSNIEDLSESYAAGSVAEVEQPLRWFYCAGLGISLLCMNIISYCHIHKSISSPRISKKFRLSFRTAIAAILICLPLADHLSSLYLISITTALFVLVLLMDIFGNSCPDQNFWSSCEGGKDGADGKCKYTAKMMMGKKKRAELQRKLMNGEDVTLEDALKRSDSQTTQVSVDVQENWFHGGHL